MANFRTSNVPSWATGDEGYFRKRTGREIDPRNAVILPNAARNPLLLKERIGLCLPKDTTLAAGMLMRKRLGYAVWHAYVYQLSCFLAFLMVFATTLFKTDGGWFSTVFRNLLQYVFCLPGVLFVSALYATLYMFMAMCTSSDANKYGVCIQEKINRCSSLRFILKPALLVFFVQLVHWYIFHMFKDPYQIMFRSKLSSTDCGSKEEQCYFMENVLATRIAISVAALDFFICGYAKGRISLQYVSTTISELSVGSMVLMQAYMIAQRSIFIVLGVSSFCLTIGPYFYGALLYPLGFKIWQEAFGARLLMFVELGFMIRSFVCIFFARMHLYVLFQLISYYLTDLVHFPLEPTTSHQKCLLLSEAMKAKSVFLKSLAFSEYNLKANRANPHVSIFYKITHPGGHPLNWKNLFNACMEEVHQLNEQVVQFLKETQLPANFLQSGLRPYILDRLRREREPDQQEPAAAVDPVEPHRVGNMRDLRNINRLDFPDQLPSIPEICRLHLEWQWNQIRASLSSFFSMKTVNIYIFGGKLDAKLKEYEISNIVSDHMLSIWAIMGTLKLMCMNEKLDSRGITHPDLKAFVVKLLETHDVWMALSTYSKKLYELQPDYDIDVYSAYCQVVTKMINTSVFALLKLHKTFAKSYSVLGIDEDLKLRILEIKFHMDHNSRYKDARRYELDDELQ